MRCKNGDGSKGFGWDSRESPGVIHGVDLVGIRYRKMKIEKISNMKKVAIIFSAVVIIALGACTSAESEMMKEARNIQAGLLKQKANLDSTIDVEIVNVDKALTLMSEDSTMATDTLKFQEFVGLKTRKETLDAAKEKMADWMINTKLLPTQDEEKNGVSNPFGPEAKDLDVLKAIKEAQSSFNDLRSQIESEIQ